MPVAAQPYTPLFLSSDATIPSGSQNGLRNEALKNPRDVPIEIMEIRFHAGQTMAERTGAGFYGPPIAGNALQVSLELGNLKLTNGAVPIWNFGRAINPTAEIDFNNNNSPPIYVYNEYEWKLAYPLVVKPGMGLSVKVISTGLVLDPISFRCSVLCRVAARKYNDGDPIMVPWVAPWISKQFIVGTTTTDSSRETDLVTPAHRDFLLSWMTARLATWAPATSTTSLGSNDDTSYPVMQYGLTRIKLRDSRGYPLIRDFTYWGSAFNQLTRAWAMDGAGFKIPADTYWIADLAVTPPTTPVVANQAQASLALVGSYEVAYGDITQ